MSAQNLEQILEFMGTDAVEELSPYDVERLEDLLSRPLRINRASESRLEESGLFSRYQVASLIDYRSRHGDVLSFSELSALDGFGREFVMKLAPFISLESDRLPGKTSLPSVRNELSARTGVRNGSTLTYGLKYKMSIGERLAGGLSVSRTAEAPYMKPDALSGYMTIYMKRARGKIVAGDFNARFGQGLALWNGLSFSGLNSSSSFMRKPSGISASSSFTGSYSMRGLAADFRSGHFCLSVMTAVSEGKNGLSALPAANIAYYFQHGAVSVTHYADFLWNGGLSIPDMKTSADMSFCFSGVDVFAETAYDWAARRIAALGGASFRVCDDSRMAAMLRFYPSGFTAERSAAARSATKCTNEYAASLAWDFSAGGWMKIKGAEGFGASVRRHSGKVSVDCAYFPESKAADVSKSIQLKAQTEYTSMLTDAFRVTFRFSERFRSWGLPFRTDFRTDLSYLSEHLIMNLRLNVLKCRGTGLLGYFEGGYKAPSLALYLRTGLFRIDNWDDRIYVYERDAPGSFNVPAFYGRGFWTAMTMNWRFARWGRAYLRAALTSYPFMAEKKPGRAELKLNVSFTF